MMISNLIGPALSAIGELLKGAIDNDAKRQEILGRIESQLITLQNRSLAAQRDVILAEAGGSWLQKSWRPGMMAIFAAIIANNYILAPYVGALTGSAVYLPIPPEMWTLMTIGIGGYIGGRSGEKMVRHWKDSA